MTGTTSQGPREQWRYRLKNLLSFFQGERRRGISALFVRFSRMDLQAHLACIMYKQAATKFRESKARFRGFLICQH